MTSRAFAPVALAALALAACERTVTNTVEVQPPASTYLVEYLGRSTDAVVGKTSFQLRIRKRADFTDATGLAAQISVAPLMTMTGMSHGAPADVVTESVTMPGTYDCAVYYLMASGAGMGYWALAVDVAGEKTTFYPDVSASPATDTVRQDLWGPADAGASTMATNKYLLFADGTPSAATPSLHLFVARAEDMFMSFKRVATGAALAGTTGTVTSVSLTASADAAFTAPVTATALGEGHYALDLSTFGLSDGHPATVYVRLSVNGEAKTTDGAAPGATNASATFVVTPRAATPTAGASTYLVEYLPGATNPVVGKSSFQLRVRRRADFAAATGLTITLAPWMKMATKDHGTPADVVTESATPGTYDCTVYWLMASGPTMGYWSLVADVGGESVTFYPQVGMGMGSDTVNQKLWGTSDTGATTMAIPKYFLFMDGQATTTTLPIFLSRSEDMMMTFKRVYPGAVLAGTGTVTSVALAASTDTAFTSPIAAADRGNGHYAVDLSSLGLAPGARTLYLRLSVNGEAKTVDGTAGGAAYATFAITLQ